MILRNTKWIGKSRLHFEEIDSTNKKAKELTQEGGEHGVLITADTQTAGVGRRGRSWSSEPGAGIYMSVILRPNLQPNQAPMLTLVVALAVAKAISDYYKEQENLEGLPHIEMGVSPAKRDLSNLSQRKVIKKLPCKIKWPNDIVINGKKICGILTEMTLNQSQIEAIILGIGINVSNTCFPEEIVSTASSLYLETGFKWEKELLIENIWKWFEIYYERFLEDGDLRNLKTEYEVFLVNKNEKVNVLDPHGEYTGVAKGITNTGELLVDTEIEVKSVSSGEVSVRGIYGYV